MEQIDLKVITEVELLTLESQILREIMDRKDDLMILGRQLNSIEAEKARRKGLPSPVKTHPPIPVLPPPISNSRVGGPGKHPQDAGTAQFDKTEAPPASVPPAPVSDPSTPEGEKVP